MERSPPAFDESVTKLFLTFTEEAEDDLRLAVSWLNVKSPGLGNRFLAEAEQCYQYIIEYPYGGQLLPEGSRRCLLRTFTYQILYVPRSSDSVVLAVLSCRIAPELRMQRSGRC